jgi:hypothetical protein
MLVLVVSIAVGIALALETVGVFGRFWGAINNKNAVGYSLHVRTATLGRFLTFAAAPTYGYLVDTGSESQVFLLIGSVVSLVCSLMTISFLGIRIPRRLQIISRLLDSRDGTQFYPSNLRFSRRIFVLTILSFGITSTGLILANLLASLYPEQRAFFVQLTSVFTASGTLIHVFYVDPILAKMCDKSSQESFNGVMSYLYGRLSSSIFLCFIFTVWMFYV